MGQLKLPHQYGVLHYTYFCEGLLFWAECTLRIIHQKQELTLSCRFIPSILSLVASVFAAISSACFTSVAQYRTRRVTQACNCRLRTRGQKSCTISIPAVALGRLPRHRKISDFATSSTHSPKDRQDPQAYITQTLAYTWQPHVHVRKFRLYHLHAFMLHPLPK